MNIVKTLAAAALCAVASTSALAEDLVSIVGFENLAPTDCPFVRDPRIVNNKLDFALNLDYLLLPGSTREDGRCLFNTTVKVKAGYRMKIRQVAFGGNVEIEGDDVLARATASYRVLGDAGPVASTGFMRSSQPFEEISPYDSNTPWSRCGGTVEIEGRSDTFMMSPSGGAVANMVIQNAAGGFMWVDYYCEPCG